MAPINFPLRLIRRRCATISPPDESTPTGRWGQLSAYYFFDDYRLDNPYPGQQGGASIPGFDALTFGRAQLVSLGDTKVFGTGTVNEVHVGYLRNANVIGQPKGGLGVSLAAQGFSSSTTDGGFTSKRRSLKAWKTWFFLPS